MSLPINILYLALHNQLKKKYGIHGTISRKEFFIKLGKHHQITKHMGYLVIKEMEEMKLIKRLDRDNIKVLEIELDIEKDASKLYELAGIYDSH